MNLLEKMIRNLIAEARLTGYIEGLTAFAWWKDGVQCVGSSATPLADAIRLAKQAKLWNQHNYRESSDVLPEPALNEEFLRTIQYERLTVEHHHATRKVAELTDARLCLERELKEVLEALYMVYMLVTTQADCDFTNGVTDPTGTFDEGHHRAASILDTARQLLVERGCLSEIDQHNT